MAYEMRQGVLWQECPTCGAKPGEGCINMASGTVADGFHSKRPDGYDDEPDYEPDDNYTQDDAEAEADRAADRMERNWNA